MGDMYRLRVHHAVELEVNEVTPETVTAVGIWCNGVEVTEHDALEHSKTFKALNVPTATGNKRAQEGDYVGRRPLGDFVVIPQATFHRLFEPVTPSTPI